MMLIIARVGRHFSSLPSFACSNRERCGLNVFFKCKLLTFHPLNRPLPYTSPIDTDSSFGGILLRQQHAQG